jgi:hypothetical protein
MALPTTGTIGHAEIMAEFEKTGKFDLSADGAPLIDKSPSTLINESDFYGASAKAPDEGGLGDPSYMCFQRPWENPTNNYTFKTQTALSPCGWHTQCYGGNNQASKRYHWGWRMYMYVFHGKSYNWSYDMEYSLENRNQWQSSLKILIARLGINAPIGDNQYVGASPSQDTIGQFGTSGLWHGQDAKTKSDSVIFDADANYYQTNGYLKYINSAAKCEMHDGGSEYTGYFPGNGRITETFVANSKLRGGVSGDKAEPFLYALASSQLYSSTKYPTLKAYKMVITPR